MEALPLHGRNGLALASFRIGGLPEVHTGGHEIDEVGGRTNPIFVGFNLGRPMRNQRGRNSSLVIVVLILAEGDVVEVGPALSDKDVGVGVARVLALVAPLDPGLGVTSVVGKKENQSILEFVPLTEGVYQLAHVLVDFLDHGSVDRHHVIVAFFLLLSE